MNFSTTVLSAQVFAWPELPSANPLNTSEELNTSNIFNTSTTRQLPAIFASTGLLVFDSPPDDWHPIAAQWWLKDDHNSWTYVNPWAKNQQVLPQIYLYEGRFSPSDANLDSNTAPNLINSNTSTAKCPEVCYVAVDLEPNNPWDEPSTTLASAHIDQHGQITWETNPDLSSPAGIYAQAVITALAKPLSPLEFSNKNPAAYVITDRGQIYNHPLPHNLAPGLISVHMPYKDTILRLIELPGSAANLATDSTSLPRQAWVFTDVNSQPLVPFGLSGQLYWGGELGSQTRFVPHNSSPATQEFAQSYTQLDDLLNILHSSCSSNFTGEK